VGVNILQFVMSFARISYSPRPYDHIKAQCHQVYKSPRSQTLQASSANV